MSSRRTLACSSTGHHGRPVRTQAPAGNTKGTVAPVGRSRRWQTRTEAMQATAVRRRARTGLVARSASHSRIGGFVSCSSARATLATRGWASEPPSGEGGGGAVDGFAARQACRLAGCGRGCPLPWPGVVCGTVQGRTESAGGHGQALVLRGRGRLICCGGEGPEATGAKCCGIGKVIVRASS